jgi:Flp pilus assembly protein TadB
VSLSRWILTALPIAVMLAISVTDPAYERPMYHTTFGIILLILCALMIVAGSLVMSRLIRIEP